MEELFRTAFFFVVTLLVGIVGWYGKRNSDRLDTLERDAVTREELKEILTGLRADRQANHQENKETLNRMESKIDLNEERAAKTRHDTLNEVHTLSLRIARISQND